MAATVTLIHQGGPKVSGPSLKLTKVGPPLAMNWGLLAELGKLEVEKIRDWD